ncbi:MAG: hypothetical protein PVSMB4_05880 [Ktedonobacterales bacterium]
MRIERLTADNQRTQGVARRQWYRQHNPDHPHAVSELLDAALTMRAPDAPRSAIVLGAGACTELPLERLARACQQVTLVDLDAAGMERARQELVPALRERVRLLVGDVSGGVSRALADGLRVQPWADLAALGEGAILGSVATCLKRCPVAIPPLVDTEAQGFGLVVSSLVLTQLFSLPLLDVVDTLAVVAPAVAGLQEADPHYRAAARAFRRRVVLAHLDLLAALLAFAGTGLLLTDITGYLLPPAGDRRRSAPRTALPLLPRDLVDLPAELDARFDLLVPPRTWEWLVSLPTSALPGRAYDVLGTVVRRRAHTHPGGPLPDAPQ